MSIIIENLNHIYDLGSPYQTNALDNVSLEIAPGTFTAIIGHTGSGKSTLIQHLNGLLKPSSGKIMVNDFEVTAKGISLIEIRKKVGLVFQYPEYQLFEETVEKDIAFGPENIGIPEEEVKSRVKVAMELVGLSYEKLKDKSPFELSGGQKRRVAIAGVLAMQPEIIILDEPTAGLDPKGREEILMRLKELNQSGKMTVILVSHSMEEVAKYVENIFVMHNGKIVLKGSPIEVFAHRDQLIEIGLGVPQTTDLYFMLKSKGILLEQNPLTVEDAANQLLNLINKKAKGAQNA